MGKYNFRYLLAFCILFSLLSQHCTFLNTSTTKKSNYRIIETEPIDTGASIRCLVFDKNYNTPIENVPIIIESVQPEGIKIGVYTKNDGIIDKFVPSNSYKIKMIYGDTRVETKPIKVSTGKRVSVRFDVYIHRDY